MHQLCDPTGGVICVKDQVNIKAACLQFHLVIK